jgi:hypothetical protein
MTALWVLETAGRFWDAAGGAPADFPRDLGSAVSWATLLSIVSLPRLWTGSITQWLSETRELAPGVTEGRALRAATYASAQGGFIFLDGADPEDERRFSLAHEVAHFIVEYVEPRRRGAARVGPGALIVMEGGRAPSTAERVAAALAGVELLPQLHLIDRTPTGQPRSYAVTRAEQRADELALELLAPVEVVQALRPASEGWAPLAAWLRPTFGLPAAVAEEYAHQLAPAIGSPFAALLPPRRLPEQPE